jgi:hypothetical protein
MNNKIGSTLKAKTQDKIGLKKTYLINLSLLTYLFRPKLSLLIHALTFY